MEIQSTGKDQTTFVIPSQCIPKMFGREETERELGLLLDLTAGGEGKGGPGRKRKRLLQFRMSKLGG